MDTKNNTPINLVILGRYTEAQANILKVALEKSDIPVRVFYPERSEGRPEWLAHTFIIPENKVTEALKICKELNFPADAKLPPSRLKKILNWIIFLLAIAALFVIGYIYF